MLGRKMLVKKKMMGPMFRSRFLFFFFILLVWWLYWFCNFDYIFSFLMNFLSIIVITCCVVNLLAYYNHLLLPCLDFDACRRVMKVVLCVTRDFGFLD